MDPTRDPRDTLDARTTTPDSTEATTRVAYAGETPPMTPPHVLIVDDDSDILDVLEMLFTDDGFQAVCCGTSEAARSVLATQVVQLLITDLRLVGGTGLDLIQHARTLYGNQPGVIVLTAMGPTHATAELEQVGQLGARIIAKPFDIDDLLSAARALTGWPGRALP